MVNYSEGLIYKLCCKDPEIKEIYVGSTTNFNRRKQEHKSCCNNANQKAYNFNVYKFIRDSGGWDNWQMVELEKYNATDTRNLHTRERYYLELLGATLNKSVPTRAKTEYYVENKEKLKQYYENNKDKKKEQKKIYYEDNKLEISEKAKEKITCICGSIYRKVDKAQHQRSKKHKTFLELTTRTN